ncbi:MAG: TonB family protein [Pyrinomonadaceae bacterium]
MIAVSLIFAIYAAPARAQTEPLTYPEIITALNSRVPNNVFRNKTEVINFLISDVKKRKVAEPLTPAVEKLLRQSGATDRLISEIRQNSPGASGSQDREKATGYYRNGTKYAKSDPDRAIAEFTKAIEIDPDYPSPFQGRGDLYREKGDQKAAIEDYTKLIALTPSDANAYFSRAQAYSYILGGDASAIRDYTKAIALNPKFIEAYIGRGYSYYFQEDDGRALADFNQAIRIDPQNADSYNARGMFFSKTLDYNHAIADFKTALRIDPNHKLAKSNLESIEEEKSTSSEGGSATGGFTGDSVSGGVLNGKAVSLPTPPYPAAARAVRAQGAVNVQVIIDENGNVIGASAVSGHPLLRAAAEQAARQAKFSPTLINGKAVKVTGVLVYNFSNL